MLYNHVPLVNLDTLLVQLRDEITSRWYEFGLAVAWSIPKEVMDSYSGYPADQCMIEMLDYWLRHYCHGQPTWKDVANALKKINLHQLADSILQVYMSQVYMHA